MNLGLKIGSIRKKLHEAETKEEVLFEKERGMEGIEINADFEVDDYFSVCETVIGIITEGVSKQGEEK